MASQQQRGPNTVPLPQVECQQLCPRFITDLGLRQRALFYFFNLNFLKFSKLLLRRQLHLRVSCSLKVLFTEFHICLHARCALAFSALFLKGQVKAFGPRSSYWSFPKLLQLLLSWRFARGSGAFRGCASLLEHFLLDFFFLSRIYLLP